jgi:hypothetical protein
MKSFKPVAVSILLLLTMTVFAQKVTFSSIDPVEGDTRGMSELMQMDMTMSVSIGGQVIQDFAMDNSEERTSVATVTGVSGSDITGLIVVYEECIEKKSEGGEVSEEVSIVSNNKYLVAIDGDEITVARVDGSEITEEEIEIVTGDYDDVNGNEISEILAGKTVRPRQYMEELTDSLVESMFDEDQRGDLKSAEIKYLKKKMVNGVMCGVFSIKLEMGTEISPGTEMTMEMEGELAVSVEGAWPVSIALTGPMVINGEMSEDGVVMTMGGGGNMSMTVSMIYD